MFEEALFLLENYTCTSDARPLVENWHTALLQHVNTPNANRTVSANRVAQNCNEMLIFHVGSPLSTVSHEVWFDLHGDLS